MNDTSGSVQGFVAEVCTSDSFFLGEGARYDEVRGELYWVNIYEGQFFRARADGTHLEVIQRYDLGGNVGAVAPFERRADGWIIARDQALYHLKESGGVDLIAHLGAGADLRVNDGAADPWGQYWVGTMALDAAPGRGSLYRVAGARQLQTVLGGLSIANGLGWSLDRRTMYFVDSGPATIYAFDVDDDGAISGQRVFVTFDPDTDGSPDGMCVDAEGALWVAMWGGRCVRRYAPNGELVARVTINTSNPSCCAIGGANGTTLYVTTAREDLSDETLANESGAGRLFAVDVGVRGQPLDAYRPRATA